jgi:hypothetical protein
MGERTQEALRVHFDTRVRLEFPGATLTSDAGLLACRELDAVLGLTQAATRSLEECRISKRFARSNRCNGPNGARISCYKRASKYRIRNSMRCSSVGSGTCSWRRSPQGLDPQVFDALLGGAMGSLC